MMLNKNIIRMFKKNKNFDFHKSKIEVPMINKIKKLSKLKFQNIFFPTMKLNTLQHLRSQKIT